MKIYMHSTVFEPSVGGVETVGELLLRSWIAVGVDIRISTDTPGPDMLKGNIPIIRQPDWREVLACTRWADIVFHNHPSARVAWAPILCRKPWFATVHTWMPCYKNSTLVSSIRRALFKPCRFLAVSDAIARHLPEGRSRVLLNPSRFACASDAEDRARDIDVLFVGRLVSDKGLDLLLDALAELMKEKCFTKTTIVGDGPLRAALESQVKELGLMDWVKFAGNQSAEQLKPYYTSARCTVVPSRWEEPFGLVAVEALACGSIPIVANSGGLPEAIGTHGFVFRSCDIAALKNALRRAIEIPVENPLSDQVAVAKWMERYDPAQVAARYIRVFCQSL